MFTPRSTTRSRSAMEPIVSDVTCQPSWMLDVARVGLVHTASYVTTVVSSHVDRAIDERALMRAPLCASRLGNSRLDARYALRASPWGWRGTAAQTQGRGGGGGEGHDTLAPSSPEKPGTASERLPSAPLSYVPPSLVERPVSAFTTPLTSGSVVSAAAAGGGSSTRSVSEQLGQCAMSWPSSYSSSGCFRML